MQARSQSVLEQHPTAASVNRAIASRIAQVASALPATQIGKLCHCSGESARRYRLGAVAPATFLHHFCRTFLVDGHWLLTGDTMPPGCQSVLQRCSTDELLEELHRRVRDRSTTSRGFDGADAAWTILKSDPTTGADAPSLGAAGQSGGGSPQRTPH